MADMKGKTRQEVIAADVKELHKLGYAQQLFREMGGFSNFAISFSIISILTGAMLLYGYGLKFAGPMINTFGWPIVSIFTMCIAASMAEIASAYPTAGGLYFWATKLGGVGWGWVTAWFNMVGQVTITAGIDIAVAIYFVGMITRMFGLDPAMPVLGGMFGWTLSSWGFYLFIMVIVMIPQVLINIYGIKLTAKLNDFSVYWHIAGVLVIALLLAVFGKNHQPFSFVTQYVNTVSPLDASSGTFADGTSGPALFLGALVLKSPLFALFPGMVNLYKVAPFVLVFPLAFLQAQWTYTGYDASAHEQRLGCVPVGGSLGRRRVHRPDGLHLQHPRHRRHGGRPVPGPVHCVPGPEQVLRRPDCHHRLRRHVAVRSGDRHQHVPDVLRLRAR
jgi:amino acid transporter